MSQVVSLNPRADREDRARAIAWAPDGGLVELPPEALSTRTCRVILEHTSRVLGNGKLVYTGKPAPDVRKVSVEEKDGQVREVARVTDWLGKERTEETPWRSPGVRVGTPSQVASFWEVDIIARVAHPRAVFHAPWEVEKVIRSEALSWRPVYFFGGTPNPPKGATVGPKSRLVTVSTAPTGGASVPFERVIALSPRWPMKAGRVPRKIPGDTAVDALVLIGESKHLVGTTTWEQLPPDERTRLLRRWPECPMCNKNRFDVTRGLNACGPCLTLESFAQAIEPMLKVLDPNVIIASGTGERISFWFADEKTRNRFEHGYKFVPDPASGTLLAGKGLMAKVWDKFRPIPEGLVSELAPLAEVFGITAVLDPNDWQRVNLAGAWLINFGGTDGPTQVDWEHDVKKRVIAERQKMLGVKGPQKKRHLLGVTAVEQFTAALWDVVTGRRVMPLPVHLNLRSPG